MARKEVTNMLTHYSITQQGKSHIEKGEPCQDYSSSKRVQIDKDTEIIVAAIADGVGSCEYSQIGSKVAVNSFVGYIENQLTSGNIALNDDEITELIKQAFLHAFEEEEKTSSEEEIPFVELDTTLTGVVYDGRRLWFGHIGDDGAVVIYDDGHYEMITNRHKGDDFRSLIPLREISSWQFGQTLKDVAACILMTDGVLDYCVGSEAMMNRVYFPFLEPALTYAIKTDQDASEQRLEWGEYFLGQGDYTEEQKHTITDDISFVVVQNPDLVEALPDISFDIEKWDKDTQRRLKELDEALYEDFRKYKAGRYTCSTGKVENDCIQDESPTSGLDKVDDIQDKRLIYDDKGIEERFEQFTSEFIEATDVAIKTAQYVGRKVRDKINSRYSQKKSTLEDKAESEE